MDVGVFEILAVAGALAALDEAVFDQEMHLQIGMATGLVVPWHGGESEVMSA